MTSEPKWIEEPESTFQKLLALDAASVAHLLDRDLHKLELVQMQRERAAKEKQKVRSQIDKFLEEEHRKL